MAGILSEPLKGIVKELGAVVVGVVEISRPEGLMEIIWCVCGHMINHSLGLPFYWLRRVLTNHDWLNRVPPFNSTSI